MSPQRATTPGKNASSVAQKRYLSPAPLPVPANGRGNPSLTWSNQRKLILILDADSRNDALPAATCAPLDGGIEEEGAFELRVGGSSRGGKTQALAEKGARLSGCLDGATESRSLGFAIGTAAKGQVGVPKGF